MKLDKAKALQAIKTHVADPLGMDVMEAAEGIVRIIDVKMEEAIKAISTMRGHDLRDFMLLPFGGAGPIHSGRMVRDLGMAGAVVPLHPGVFSAMGLVMSDVKHDYIRSRLQALASVDPAELDAIFGEMEGKARAELSAEGFHDDKVQINRFLDLRYSGQGYELTLPVTKGADIAAIRTAFDAEHESTFGHAAPGEVVDIVSFRVQAVGLVPPVDPKRYANEGGTLEQAFLGTRPVRFDGKDHDCAIYQRERLDVGLSFEGPAVVEQFDCTTVILPRPVGAGRRIQESDRDGGCMTMAATQDRVNVTAVELEVIRASLSGIVQEMQNSLFRTGFSTIIRESQDASCALLDAEASVIAQHVVLPLHLGAFPACTAAVLRSFGDDIAEGDAFLINHPYEGGSPHAPDMAVISPIFFGGELVGFCASIAHKSDIGGPVPGSCSGQAREIYNEGLQLPAVRYQRDFKPFGDVERIIAANSRTPELVLGDIRGQLGSARLGERRLGALLEKFGTPKCQAAFDELSNIAERRMRAAIAEWKDGSFEAERFLDDDGVDLSKPIRIHVRVDKVGDQITFDFTSSADQAKGPANIRPPLVQAACAYALISLIDPDIFISSGILRAFNVETRAGQHARPVPSGPGQYL